VKIITIILISVPGIFLLTARFSSKCFVLFIKEIAIRIPHNLKDITKACV